MTALGKQQMSVDEFATWARQQPDRWELLDGHPVATLRGSISLDPPGIELQARELLP